MLLCVCHRRVVKELNPTPILEPTPLVATDEPRPTERFKPYLAEPYDAWRDRYLDLSPEDLLIYKVRDELDDLGAFHRTNYKIKRRLGHLPGIQHYQFNMKLKQLKKLTTPQEFADRKVERYKPLKLPTSQPETKDKTQRKSRPLPFEVVKHSYTAHLLGPPPHYRTFMYTPDKAWKFRGSYLPDCAFSEKYQIDHRVLDRSKHLVRVMEEDERNKLMKLRNFFRIGAECKPDRVTLGLEYKKPGHHPHWPGKIKGNPVHVHAHVHVCVRVRVLLNPYNEFQIQY